MKKPFPAEFTPNTEGKNHYNAYSQSNTILGLLLSNFEGITITLPKYGTFASLEGLWYWLKTGNDALRTMVGYEAKKFGSKLPVTGLTSDTQEFREIMLEAMWLKINASDQLRTLLTESSLPIVHYYVRKTELGDPFVVPLQEHDWLWEAVEVYRDYLKAGKQPTRFDLLTQIIPVKEEQLSMF